MHSGVSFQLRAKYLLPEDDSPYPEVRSAVANTDDPTIPVSTLRSWVLGLIWAIIIPGLNQFFFFRYPSVSVTGVRSVSCYAHSSSFLIDCVSRLSPSCSSSPWEGHGQHICPTSRSSALRSTLARSPSRSTYWLRSWPQLVLEVPMPPTLSPFSVSSTTRLSTSLTSGWSSCLLS